MCERKSESESVYVCVCVCVVRGEYDGLSQSIGRGLCLSLWWLHRMSAGGSVAIITRQSR